MIAETDKSATIAFTWCFVSATVLFEAVTIACRIVTGHSAAEFNRTNPPLLLQVNHMFWSLPLFAAAFFLRRRPLAFAVLLALACSLVASDLVHHFAVLPLWKGNTGWHWP